MTTQQGLMLDGEVFDEPCHSHLVSQPDYLGGGYHGSIGRDFHRCFGAELTLNLS